ncbi:MAG: hypothetical protein NTV43_08590 [Methylococcales bacterium]|nr:hypothetical protein [Methylococcales bacterium]
MNIWFLRTDKDGWNENFDISESNEFIYSAHGSCGNQKNRKIQDQKSNIFPKLLISGEILRKLVRLIKQELIEEGCFSGNEVGKKQCDSIICYWIAVMNIGDIVFVRNKKQDIYICKIAGYISEDFFDKTGAFQRPVEIVKKVSSNASQEKVELDKIWQRTLGRRAIERNTREDVKVFVYNYLKGL